MDSLGSASLNKHENYANNSLSQDNEIKTVVESFFKNIVHAAREQDDETCTQKLNNLCGETGFIRLSTYYRDFQIQLNFASEQLRQEFKVQFSNQLRNFGLSKTYEDWQCEDKDDLFVFKCNSNQSVALLGIDPRLTHNFLRGQDLLEKIREKLRLKSVQKFFEEIPRCINELEYMLTHSFDHEGPCWIPLSETDRVAIKNMEIALDLYLTRKDLKGTFKPNTTFSALNKEQLCTVENVFKAVVAKNGEFYKTYECFLLSNHVDKSKICHLMNEIIESIEIIFPPN